MHPIGKGIFIWQLKASAGGDHIALASKAQEAGFSWVAVKVCDGIGPYNAERLIPAVAALKGAGVRVWGWGYAYGADWAKRSQAAGEAKIAAAQVSALDLDGFLIDAEKEYKRPGANAWAETYMTALRLAVPDKPLGLCSYRFPSLHPELPWTTFLRRCDFHAPQVYWAKAHNPQYQLGKSIEELRRLKDLPVVPVGAAYHEGGWGPTAEEINAFDAEAHALNLPGIFWWVWQHAEEPAHRDWWAAIASHQWPIMGQPPAPDTIEERVTDLERRVAALEA